MEMPCLCDCGKWFDLTDGWPSKYDNKIVCESCHNIEREIEDIELHIEDLEAQGNKKREIKKWQTKLSEFKSKNL